MGIKVQQNSNKREKKDITVEPVTEHLVSKIESSWSHKSGYYEQEGNARTRVILYLVNNNLWL